MPLVDVIIATYQRPQALARALDSVQRQSFADWACWVAPDGPLDAVREVKDRFAADARFRYLPGRHAGRPAVPRNRALWAGEAEFVAFLDDDDVWLPDKLAAQLDVMRRRPECVMVATNAHVSRGEKMEDRFLPLYFHKRQPEVLEGGSVARENLIILSTVLVRRVALQAAAGFEESRRLIGVEDFNLWLRLAPMGSVYFDSKPYCVYSDGVYGSHRSAVAGRVRSLQQFRAYAHALSFVRWNALGASSERVRGVYAAKASVMRRKTQAAMAQEALVAMKGLARRALAAVRPSGRGPADERGRSGDTAAVRGAERVREPVRSEAGVDQRSPGASTEPDQDYGVLVFSKDRPLQLLGLLESMSEMLRPAVSVRVVYRASTLKHREAYEQMLAGPFFHGVRGIPEGEGCFKDIVLSQIDDVRCRRMFFLVDDILFKEETNLAVLDAFPPARYVPSLRMGRHIECCYAMNRPIRTPNLDPCGKSGELFTWPIVSGDGEWGYVLSMDGHVFDAAEIRTLMTGIEFQNPNQLESALQVFQSLFDNRRGVAWDRSRVFNLPMNRVQDEFRNRSGSVSSDLLLDLWTEGFRLEHPYFRGIVNTSVHQEVCVPLIRREGSETRRILL